MGAQTIQGRVDYIPLNETGVIRATNTLTYVVDDGDEGAKAYCTVVTETGDKLVEPLVFHLQELDQAAGPYHSPIEPS